MRDLGGDWCEVLNALVVNNSKSGVLHVRPRRKQRNNSRFTIKGCSVEVVERYNYLGLPITEHLDLFKMMEERVASSNRALSTLICKCTDIVLDHLRGW